MTSVSGGQQGVSPVILKDDLDVSQGEEALDLAAVGDVNKSLDTSQVSGTGESITSESMDTSVTSSSESAPQSSDSAIGGTPALTPNSTPVLTPENEDGPEILPKRMEAMDGQELMKRIQDEATIINTKPEVKAEKENAIVESLKYEVNSHSEVLDARETGEPRSTPATEPKVEELVKAMSDLNVAAGDRLDEDGYDEDDEEEEDPEEDSLSDSELVVSASMQFPLGQKPNREGGKTGSAEKDEVLGAGGAQEDTPAPELIQGVTVQVNSSSQLLARDGSPSGCESDVEDNADEDRDPIYLVHPMASKHLVGSTNCFPVPVALPDTVTRLSTPHGSAVYLVGTAHFSRESQEDVAETIRKVKPDIVVVELCKARTAILQLDEETILQESRSLDFKKMQMILRQHGKIQGVLYLLLLSVSAHITKQLGMAPGGEFRTAFSEARRSAPGCLIQLGDRPIQVTLSRALASLSLWHKVKLTWHILTSKEPISKEEVEKCKQRDFIEEMLAEMTGQFPAISEVFVKERDLYLCRSLQVAAQPVPNPLSPTGMMARIVVGVVGIGHVPGIVDHWGKVTDADIAPIMRIPPPSLSSKLMKMGMKATMYGLLGFGAYKCLPSTVKSSLHSSAQSALQTASVYLPQPWRK